MKERMPEGFAPVEEGIWTILAPPGGEEEARSCLRRPAVGILIETARSPERGWEPRGPVAAGTSGEVEVLPPPAGGGPAGRGIVVRVRLGGGRVVILKALHRGGHWGRLRGGFHGRGRLIGEMRTLDEAARRGIPVPRLAFGATARRPDGGAAAVLATWEIEGAVALPDLVRSAARSRRPGEVPRMSLNASIARAGRAVRRAHDLGLDHADLNVGNILVAPRPSPGWRHPGGMEGGGDPGAWLIDLGASRLGGPLATARRAANLVRLLRSAEKHLGRDPRRTRDAAAFLHGYLASERGCDRALRRALLPAIRRRLPLVAVHRLGWALTRSR